MTNCMVDADCAKASTGTICDVSTGECVGCLPGVTMCPTGEYCDETKKQCAAGCVDDTTCSGTTPLCDPFTHECAECVVDTDCPSGSICGANLCFPGCDPLLQDCPGDEICVPWPGHGYFGCLSDVSGDLGVVNDPCDFAKACDGGLVCLDAGAASSACLQGVEGCCQPFCAFVEGEDGECPNGDQTCVQWVDEMGMVIEGLEDVGVCRIAL